MLEGADNNFLLEDMVSDFESHSLNTPSLVTESSVNSGPIVNHPQSVSKPLGNIKGGKLWNVHVQQDFDTISKFWVDMIEESQNELDKPIDA